MARKRKIRLGEMDRDIVMEAAGKVTKYCLAHFKTKQYVSTCAKTIDIMTKSIIKHSPNILPRDIAVAANVADVKCAKYKRKDYGRVCFRVVGGYIRTLSKLRPGLQGKNRR
jgi:hypothetical protein